jgi:hypothetical protein
MRDIFCNLSQLGLKPQKLEGTVEEIIGSNEK